MRCPSNISAGVKISVVSVVVKGSVIVDLVPKIIPKGVASHIIYKLMKGDKKRVKCLLSLTFKELKISCVNFTLKVSFNFIRWSVALVQQISLLVLLY